MSEESFVGKGIIYIGVRGENKLFDIGNCSGLVFNAEESEISVGNYRTGGGGKANSVSRVDSVGMDITMLEMKPDNLALLIRGAAAAVTAGAVAAEAHTANQGALVAFNNIPDSSVTPTVTGTGGSPSYSEGTDFTVVGAGIIPVVGGSISDGTDIEVGYTKSAGNIVEALVNAGLEYEMVFDGLNEAQSGRKVVVKVHRCKFSPGQTVPFISDEFAEFPVTGESLQDATITGANKSQYYTVEQESAA